MTQPYGTTNEVDTCLWCGRKLRQQYNTTWKILDDWNKPTRPCCKGFGYEHRSDEERRAGHNNESWYRWRCTNPKCGAFNNGSSKRKLTSRKKTFDKPGGYGDGYFCGHECSHEFAVVLANNGRRLKPAERRSSSDAKKPIE